MPTPDVDQARRDFNLALAWIVVPFTAFALSAALALKHARARGEAEVAWARRLAALAVLDFVVLLATIAFAVGRLPVPAPPAPPAPRVGVTLDPRDRGEGAIVVSALPGSPAAQAGIRAGDAVTAIDGQPVTTNAEMSAAIGATVLGQERTLTVRRDGQALEVRVRPAMIATATPGRAPLFRPEGPGPPLRSQIEHLGAAWGAAVVLLAVIALAGARRGTAPDPPALGVWLGVAAALAAGDAALIGTTLAVEKVVGGGSLGGSLVGLLAGSATLLTIAAAWRSRLLWRGALVLDPRGEPAPGAVVLGIGYILAGLVRVGIVLAAAIPLLHLPENDPGSEIRELVNGGLHPAGTALLVLAAVVVAPIGEETLFRGVLLPWLRRFLSPDAAAWASAWVFAAGHLRYGVHVLVVLVYGLVLAWARMRTGRLRASIALHMIINATALAVTLLQG